MNKERIIQEIRFKAVRSSGAGGQHVNKVSSKIELIFDLLHSSALSDSEKQLVIQKLGSKLTKEQLLLMQCDTSRSQHKNKELVIKRFLEVMEAALLVPKPRKKTKPSKAAKEKRLKSKQKKAEKKLGRKKPPME